jgi:hypothetical protein
LTLSAICSGEKKSTKSPFLPSLITSKTGGVLAAMALLISGMIFIY